MNLFTVTSFLATLALASAQLSFDSSDSISAPTGSYGAPSEQVSTKYGVNSADTLEQQPSVIRRVVVEPSAAAQNTVTTTFRRINAPVQQTVSTTRTRSRPAPIPIVRSVYNAPSGNDGAWDYAYESGNGIKQEAQGSLRSLGDSQVVVMRGSYSYPGPDGLTYVVDWYADETGFHPSAPHLPQPVEIPFPEQAEAVAAQIRFAQEQRSLEAQGSNNVESFAELEQYGN